MASAADISLGEQVYEDNCAVCHGPHADQRAFGKARPLDTLDEASIRETLLARRAGKPTTPEDRAKAALSDAEVDAVAAYLATLRRKP